MLEQKKVHYRLPLFAIAICLIALNGCALMVMDDHQTVEIISLSKARLVTPDGQRIEFSPNDKKQVSLKRSRPDPTMKIYCAGSNKPENTFFITRPGWAFLLGNFLMFPVGHLVDIFFDTSYDYQSPVYLPPLCQTKAQLSSTKNPLSKIFSRYVDPLDGESVVMSRVYKTKTDDGSTIELFFVIGGSSSHHVLIMFMNPDSPCLDETSQLGITFQNGKKSHFPRDQEFRCSSLDGTGFRVDVNTFPKAAIKAIKVTDPRNPHHNGAFAITKTMNTQLSRLIQSAVKDAGRILRNEVKMTDVIAH